MILRRPRRRPPDTSTSSVGGSSWEAGAEGTVSSGGSDGASAMGSSNMVSCKSDIRG